eukprot:PhF_6_TR30388/c0_g1_i1/m.44548/K11426/SMYD; SET and MYND domain-containing protein
MVRMKLSVMRREAQAELFKFSLRRSVEQLHRGNPALASDYILRALTIDKKNEEALLQAYRCGLSLQLQTLIDTTKEQLEKLNIPLPSVVPPNRNGVEEDGYEELTVTGKGVVDAEAFGNVSYGVSVQEASGFGRGIFATKEVPAGTVVLRDKPFLSLPTTTQRGASICDNCLAPCHSNEQKMANPEVETSPQCVLNAKCPVSFCSVQCAGDAGASYHGPICENQSFKAFDGMCQGGNMESVDNNQDTTSAIARTCRMIGRISALSTVRETHPLILPEIAPLSGYVKYESRNVFDQVSSLTLDLGQSLRQPLFFLEDFMSLYAVIQMNEVVVTNGVRLYPYVSFLNHSCVPNAEIDDSDPQGKIIVKTIEPVKVGQQIFVNYNPRISNLPHEQRAAYHEQRGFTCTCQRCVNKL